MKNRARWNSCCFAISINLHQSVNVSPERTRWRDSSTEEVHETILSSVWRGLRHHPERTAAWELDRYGRLQATILFLDYNWLVYRKVPPPNPTMNFVIPCLSIHGPDSRFLTFYSTLVGLSSNKSCCPFGDNVNWTLAADVVQSIEELSGAVFKRSLIRGHLTQEGLKRMKILIRAEWKSIWKI